MVFFLPGPINPLEGLLGVLVCAPPPRVNVHAARMNTDFRAPHHLLLKRTWAMSLNGTALIDKNKDSQGIVSKECCEG